MIAELLEFGYLDDARYARVFTQDKRTLEAWGNERIARTLRERGVERELIERARRGSWRRSDADRAADELSELDRAIALLGRRFPPARRAARP